MMIEEVDTKGKGARSTLCIKGVHRGSQPLGEYKADIEDAAPGPELCRVLA
jgi:hypothetical protein